MSPTSGALIFGTTSYVVPASAAENVRVLAPLVDDIELVLFEGPEGFPTEPEVETMRRHAADGECGFTVHLPLDTGLGDPDPIVRRNAVDVCLRAIERTRALPVRAFVAHPELPLAFHPPSLGEPPPPLDGFGPEQRRRWEPDLTDSLKCLAEAAPAPLSVENLHYPFDWLDGVLEAGDFSVTLDVGHLLVHQPAPEGGLTDGDPVHGGAVGGGPTYGGPVPPDPVGSVEGFLQAYGGRLRVVHLHGVQYGQDHLPPGVLGTDRIERLLGALRSTRHGAEARTPPLVVTLEVFGLEKTVAALEDVAAATVSGAAHLRRAADTLRSASV